MSAVLIISIFLLVAASLAIYRTKRRSLNGTVDNDFLPRPARGLFDETHGSAVFSDAARAKLDSSADVTARLREQAREGRLETLGEARSSGDSKLYDEVLTALVTRDATIDNVLSVASHVAGSESLRANEVLANALLLAWKLTPEKVPLTRLLRVAALSDDADVFRRIVGEVLEVWERGRVPGKTAEDLRQLFDGESWVLSAEARRSGAGFLLNQELAGARRRLASHARRDTLSAEPGEVEPAPPLR